MDHMAKAIKDGKPVKTPGSDGLKDMRVIEAIYEAAKSGQTVAIG